MSSKLVGTAAALAAVAWGPPRSRKERGTLGSSYPKEMKRRIEKRRRQRDAAKVARRAQRRKR